MATTREDLKERVIALKDCWFNEADENGKTHFEKMLDQALNLTNLEKADDNYAPAYPIFAAILERYAYSATHGSAYEQTRKKCEKEKNRLKRQMTVFV